MEMTSGNFEWDTVVLRQDKEMLPLMFCEVDVRKLSGSFGHDHGCSGAVARVLATLFAVLAWLDCCLYVDARPPDIDPGESLHPENS